MQTKFTAAQLHQPEMIATEKAIRTCVHCGFCLATCPTYLLLGDELDSPRGRIYQIKEMLESDLAPSPETVKHVDRCLSCLSCVTTCPSGVNYTRLIDQARSYIEENHTRSWHDRWLRAFLAFVLPRRAVFRTLLRLSPLGRPFAALLPARLRAMVLMAPSKLPARHTSEVPQVFRASGECKGRIALLIGCAQPVLAPQINAAAVRYFNRLGKDVIVAPGVGCCGALPHHLGKIEQSHAMAKANIAAWSTLIEEEGGLDAIVITASGCGTSVKDYGYMFKDNPVWSERAARVSTLAKDVSEVLVTMEDAAPVSGYLARDKDIKVAYQSACSMQHGQQITREPIDLLKAAGFIVVEPKEKHICCGSAGTYNILQPEIATQLRSRKAQALEATGADVIATGNLGCMAQIAQGTNIPVLHTLELLDWAAGGPMPQVLAGRSDSYPQK
jgi:glycolate oxidase iron-sulfur subunit